ncbi:MAG: NAD-dependent epimerase/dehydratase family protein [Proteobacteria bacterium]|nr:NAD-dependent epimerase/dehydratase family protein [Pseudomonadota bacterium]MDA1022975.1 NAD-dependent epimerase/dehydratase family protein [Pseudomonadota bacterium]
MKIVITGGLGFLGLGIARKLIERDEVESLVLFDVAVPDALPDGLDDRVIMLAGDISDTDQVSALIDQDDIAVFHLASVVSAGGEKDFDLAMRVNLDGGRNILDACRARKSTPKVIFTSSLAVFGGNAMPDTVTDMTRVVPETTYGMTKAVGEMMINEYTRKGFIDGRAARLPTVIIRPGPPNAAASGFASGVFREPLAAAEHILPVTKDTKMMVIGYRKAVAGLIGLLDAAGDDIGPDRVVGLPNKAYSVAEMIAALEQVAKQKGISLGPITPTPDPAVEAIVTSWPLAMEDTRAKKLSLSGDKNLEAIIEEYLEDFG